MRPQSLSGASNLRILASIIMEKIISGDFLPSFLFFLSLYEVSCHIASTGSNSTYIAMDDGKRWMLPPLPNCWDLGDMLPCLILFGAGDRTQALCMPGKHPNTESLLLFCLEFLYNSELPRHTKGQGFWPRDSCQINPLSDRTCSPAS